MIIREGQAIGCAQCQPQGSGGKGFQARRPGVQLFLVIRPDLKAKAMLIDVNRQVPGKG
jgi:hypothetical protein